MQERTACNKCIMYLALIVSLLANVYIIYPPLKGPKREIFVVGTFAKIRPIWLGYLVTRPKNPKKLRLGPYITLYFPRFCFSAVAYSFFELDRKKKVFRLLLKSLIYH